MEHMQPVSWDDLLAGLEAEYARSRKERSRAGSLLPRVAQALSLAESNCTDAAVIDRLDMMQIALTEAAKDNVCTNTKCPHYNSKCKMR